MESTALEELIPPVDSQELDQLEVELQARLVGRVHDLRLVRQGQGIVLTGRAGRGYAVATAGDGDTSHRGFEQAPEVIVLDWHLPGNGAPQLLQDARARLPEVPVVVLVDPGAAAGAVEALKQGAFAYLTTPVPP